MARKRKVDVVAVLAERASMRPEDVEEFVANLDLFLMTRGTPLLYPLRRMGADYGYALVEGAARKRPRTKVRGFRFRRL